MTCLLITGWSITARADDPPPPEPQPSSAAASEPAPDSPTATPAEPAASPSAAPTAGASEDDDQKLPDIEARTFAVKIARRSTSGRTYMFDDVSDSKTHPGKILLLRREAESIMAFRVVKIYPENKQFAAKRVRRYGNYRILDPGDSYLAIEKVGDVTLPPPTAQDKADLKELEGKAPDASPGDAAPPPTAPAPAVQAYDPDLDAGTSPPPNGAVDSDNAKDNPHDDDDDDSRFGATIEEVNPLDPHSQWLTLEFGYFNNDNNYFAGGGLRYGLSLGKMIFLRRAHLQDSLAVEAGAFLYKVINFKTQGDAYTIASLIGTARYNIVFSENFGIFFYGGVMQNFVTDVVGGDSTTQAQLQSYLPAAGAGLMFRVGPSWEARVDLGYEMLGLGLILRF